MIAFAITTNTQLEPPKACYSLGFCVQCEQTIDAVFAGFSRNSCSRFQFPVRIYNFNLRNKSHRWLLKIKAIF